MFNLTQDKIMFFWNTSNLPLVSIRCITYNHAPYIAQCLDGFLSQNTNFPFEIIVHDDASTDGTASIIKEYEKKYPKIIKGIYQIENQHSKQDNSINRIINPLLRGKYVALCEGDDFWCCSNKLQKQIDFLENNSEYSACVHNTLFLNLCNNKKYVRYSEKVEELTLNDVLNRNDWHTSSLVCKTDLFVNRPSFCFAQKGVGDFPLAIYLSMSGRIKRFGDVWSVYRLGVPGSWQMRVGLKPIKQIENLTNKMRMLHLANEYSCKVYEDIFNKKIKETAYLKAKFSKDLKEMKSIEFREFWKEESIVKKLYYLITFRLKKWREFWKKEI